MRHVSHAGTILILLAAAAGLPALFHTLNATDNSPADYTRYAPALSKLSLVAGTITFLLTIPFATHDAPARVPRRLARAARTSLAALGLGFVLWWLPVPFGPTRYLTLLILLFAAWRQSVAALAAIMPGRPRVPGSAVEPPYPRWSGPMCAFAAAVHASHTLILAKLNGLAWAYAID